MADKIKFYVNEVERLYFEGHSAWDSIGIVKELMGNENILE